MSGSELILPDSDAPIDWLRYRIAINFYPPIKLTRRDGLKFGESIAEYLEPEEVHPGNTEWHFVGGATCEGMHLKIKKTTHRIRCLRTFK